MTFHLIRIVGGLLVFLDGDLALLGGPGNARADLPEIEIREIRKLGTPLNWGHLTEFINSVRCPQFNQVNRTGLGRESLSVLTINVANQTF